MNEKERETHRPVASRGPHPTGPAEPRPIPAEGAHITGVLVEEALALTLRGRIDEALALLAGPEGSGAGGASRAGEPSARLAAARILHLRARDADRERARSLLSAIVGERGRDAWRARLELARTARAEGRIDEAASHLQGALLAFRDGNGDAGADPRLAALLSRDVEQLQAAARPGPGAAAPAGSGARTSGDLLDPRSLLRLVELGKRLATEGEPDTVLRIVLHEAIQLTGAQRGFLVLVPHGAPAGPGARPGPGPGPGAPSSIASDRASAVFDPAGFEFALAENIDRTEIQQPSFEVSRTLIQRAIEVSHATSTPARHSSCSVTAWGRSRRNGMRSTTAETSMA